MNELVLNSFKDELLKIDSNISNVITILSGDFWVDGNTWYEFAKTINGVVEPIALIILCVCFLVDFLKMTIHMDILKWEFLLKCFLKFVFGKVCIEGAMIVLGAIYSTSAQWISQIGTSVPQMGNTTYLAIQSELSSYNFMQVLGLCATSMISVKIISLVSIIVQVIAYARKFEIIMYLSIAPLPCAFLPLEEGGASRIPRKYVMNFASVCLQGVFILMSIQLYNVLCNESLLGAIQGETNISSILGQMILGSLVLVMAVVKSSSWARNVLDGM